LRLDALGGSNSARPCSELCFLLTGDDDVVRAFPIPRFLRRRRLLARRTGCLKLHLGTTNTSQSFEAGFSLTAPTISHVTCLSSSARRATRCAYRGVCVRMHAEQAQVFAQRSRLVSDWDVMQATDGVDDDADEGEVDFSASAAFLPGFPVRCALNAHHRGRVRAHRIQWAVSHSLGSARLTLSDLQRTLQTGVVRARGALQPRSNLRLPQRAPSLHRSLPLCARMCASPPLSYRPRTRGFVLTARWPLNARELGKLRWPGCDCHQRGRECKDRGRDGNDRDRNDKCACVYAARECDPAVCMCCRYVCRTLCPLRKLNAVSLDSLAVRRVTGVGVRATTCFRSLRANTALISIRSPHSPRPQQSRRVRQRSPAVWYP
jgi:hypothetical protein